MAVGGRRRRAPLFKGACHATVTFENRMEPFPIGLGKRVEVRSCVTPSRDLSRNPSQNTAKQEFTRGMLQNRAYPLRPLKYCAEWQLLTTLV